MKAILFRWSSIVSLLVLSVGRLSAPETNEVETLRRELREMRKHMEELEQKLEKLGAAPTATTSVDAQKQQQSDADRKKLEAELAAELATNQPPSTAQVPVAAKSWSPTDPIRIGKGGTYADLGLVATFAAGGSTASDIEGGTQLGGHDPNQNGFTVQGVELNLQGAVDPYFRGNANIAFLLDSGGETSVELEEGWLETVSLPWNLQVRAGQILSEFGRINTQHPHSWAFVDSPLVNARLLGPDGMRNPGARLSWLAPTPFYSELFLGIQNSQGETAHSFRSDHDGAPFLGRLDNGGNVEHLGDMLFTARYAASFDLNDTQTLLAGTSAAVGPNSSGKDTDTQIYGVDLYWKWKSPRAEAGFPFVSWQTEAMVRRYQAGAFTEDLNGNLTLDPDEPDLNGDGLVDSVPSETLTDWGFYTQILYGFKKGWVAGLRGDYVTAADTGAYEAVYGPDQDRATRWRISPNLTWYPSEFSKLRLQYNCDHREGIGMDHSVWLQFEILLGAHSAHKF